VNSFAQSVPATAEQVERFAPECIITVDQWLDTFHRRIDHTPEQRLYYAILEDAFRSLTSDKLRPAALDWFAGVYSRVSFDECCDALSINPTWLREQIARKTSAGESIIIKRKSPVLSGKSFTVVQPDRRLQSFRRRALA
jgi:hypothetical protein